MTIFLTTQYLEEADELADRVGILNHGRLVAEGTPTELKRNGRRRPDRGARRGRPRGRTTRRRQGSTASATSRCTATSSRSQRSEGAAAISPVAVALNECGVRVREITLRTPTLDDVFLELTGNRIQHDDQTEEAEAA